MIVEPVHNVNGPGHCLSHLLTDYPNALPAWPGRTQDCAAPVTFSPEFRADPVSTDQ